MWFDVVYETSKLTEGFETVKLYGKSPTEIVKYYAMFLMHKGILQSYAEEGEPSKVLVN